MNDGLPHLNLQVTIYPLFNGGIYFNNGFRIPNGLNRWIRVGLGFIDLRVWWVPRMCPSAATPGPRETEESPTV